MTDMAGITGAEVVDTTATTLTVEDLRRAFEKIKSALYEPYEPHRHLFNGRATVEDGVYRCVGCGSAYEWRNGQPVVSA